jgi:hypothetical protein
MNKFLLAGIALILSVTAAYAQNLQVCDGKYALCAASTCTPTGKTMTVGGNTFPEMKCECPILKGTALADVTGGNMQGSCASANKDEVWSLFSVTDSLPQEKNNWSRKPADMAAQYQVCKHNAFTNCFSFSCRKVKDKHGVEIAVCTCPQNENLKAEPVPIGAFGTEAGQGDAEYCNKSPVGAPLP